MKPSIQQVDNFFPQDIAQFISNYVMYEADYRYGERDEDGDPTGMACDLFHAERSDNQCTTDEGKIIYNAFIKAVHDRWPGTWDQYRIYRLYVNAFAPKEQAYFHQDCDNDSDQVTFVYYPFNDLFDWAIEDGGCTEFYIDKRVIGVPPFSNSVARFSSQAWHRATPFRNHARFSIAVKCIGVEEFEQTEELFEVNE